MKIQVLLWLGMVFANAHGAFGLEVSGLAVASFIVSGILLLASFVQLRKTKRLRKGWLAPPLQDRPTNESREHIGPGL
jgi:Na+-driven multidrug efflux pump